MKRIFFILLTICLSYAPVKASHLLGGEITWECVTSGTNTGKLIFTLKLYRACYQGAAGLGSSATINNPLMLLMVVHHPLQCLELRNWIYLQIVTMLLSN